jgi:hypothetical protein
VNKTPLYIEKGTIRCERKNCKWTYFITDWELINLDPIETIRKQHNQEFHTITVDKDEWEHYKQLAQYLRERIKGETDPYIKNALLPIESYLKNVR